MARPFQDSFSRLANQRAMRGPSATGFVSQPEPRSFGSVARGRQLLAGNFLFAGFFVEAPLTQIWDLPMPAPRFETELHGFRWLDDLAAVGTPEARACAQDWLRVWIARYGSGTGPGWAPEIVGRRLIRLVNHALFLLHGQDKASAEVIFHSLGKQCHLLARRWHKSPPGLPQFEALAGLVYAGLSLTEMERHVGPALAALQDACEEEIDPEGGIATRNPEELMEVFVLLAWVTEALDASGRFPRPAMRAAMERIAPTLRALRHADGALARFHGGSSGIEGRLDQALAAASIRGGPRAQGLAMGFARLAAGRTTLIADAAPPPSGEASRAAHASTLAIELTSGRRPVIVNCGSGAEFGETWRRTGRATHAHSTLGLDGVSSARVALSRLNGGPDSGPGSDPTLEHAPSDVRVQFASSATGQYMMIGHDGYAASHGLTHVRKITLSRDGRLVGGRETLGALTERHRSRFDKVLTETNLQGVGFALRFHLHPDVDATVDMGGRAVSLLLASGEVWLFRFTGAAELTLEPSVYLEAGRLKPRGTQQIVLSGRVIDFSAQIGWTLDKAEDTPRAIRDLAARIGEDDAAFN
ncbi:MAG: heparinase II/III family protein [Pseudomonadota bacterium]